MAKLSYKKKLLNVSDLKHQGLSVLFNRVSLLVEVFEDAEFRSDTGGDDFTLAEVLDRYVDDCALTFLQLRSVRQVFPCAEQWQTKSLRTLYEEALAASKTTPEETERPERHRRAVSIKEFDAVNEKLKESEHRTTTMIDELGKLRDENRTLVSENARLEGRIVELERAIERGSRREFAAH